MSSCLVWKSLLAISKWILSIKDSETHELCNDIHLLIEKSEIRCQQLNILSNLLYKESDDKVLDVKCTQKKQELMVLQKFDLSTCRELSRQLQEFDLRRIRIFSKFDVLHIFKARMVEASFLHRSFQSNEQAPCTHPLLSLPHRTYNFSLVRQNKSIQILQCLIAS